MGAAVVWHPRADPNYEPWWDAAWAEMLHGLATEARANWELEAFEAVDDQAVARRLTAYQFWRLSRHVTDADAAPSWETWE